jgi:hypothetical protein
MSDVSTGITMEQLQTLLAAQAEMTKSIVAEAIKAAKEPTEDEKEKRTELQRRAAISRKQARDQFAAEENAKKQRHAQCSHKKENGKFATSGQVIGGRYAILVCQHCQDCWYREYDREVTAQLLSGDLTLFQADPAGWSKEMPWPMPQLAEAVA